MRCGADAVRGETSVSIVSSPASVVTASQHTSRPSTTNSSWRPSEHAGPGLLTYQAKLDVVVPLRRARQRMTCSWYFPVVRGSGLS